MSRHHHRGASAFGARWARRQEYLYKPRPPLHHGVRLTKAQRRQEADEQRRIIRGLQEQDQQARREHRQRQRDARAWQRERARAARKAQHRTVSAPSTWAETAADLLCVLGLLVAVVSLFLLFLNVRLYGATLLGGLVVWLLAARRS